MSLYTFLAEDRNSDDRPINLVLQAESWADALFLAIDAIPNAEGCGPAHLETLKRLTVEMGSHGSQHIGEGSFYASLYELTFHNGVATI